MYTDKWMICIVVYMMYTSQLCRIAAGDEDGNNQIKWREDARCGPNYPLADGSPSECYPDECCSSYHWCGNTPDHCECLGCIDYRDPLLKLFDGPSSKDDAQTTCEANGMTLVKDLSKEKHSAIIIEIVRHGLFDKDIWIDGKQESGNQWVTNDGIPLTSYQPWVAGEPNGSGHCLQLWAARDLQWDDTPCNITKPFVCEVKDFEYSINLQIVNSTSRSATISWQDQFQNARQVEILDYKVRYTADEETRMLYSTFSHSTVILLDLRPGTQYMVSVTGNTLFGSNTSNEVQFVTDPEPPLWIDVIDFDSHSIQLWFQVGWSKHDFFKVAIQKKSGGDYEEVNATLPKVTLEQLIPETIYEISVKTVINIGGNTFESTKSTNVVNGTAPDYCAPDPCPGSTTCISSSAGSFCSYPSGDAEQCWQKSDDKQGNSILMSFTLENAEYFEELTDRTSPKFKQLEEDIIREISQLYANNRYFKRVEITEFRPGSIVVVMNIVLHDNATESAVENAVESATSHLRLNGILNYTTSNVTRQKDYCYGKPCQNGGICVSGSADYVCYCRYNYSGKSCEHGNEVNFDASDAAAMSKKVLTNVLLTITILIPMIILINGVFVYKRVKKRTSVPTKRVSEVTCVPGRKSFKCTIKKSSFGDDRVYSKQPGRRDECKCTAKSITNQPKENSIGTASSTSARVITRLATPDDNFYIKMIAVVGPEGGTLSSSETGVSLFIPEMAVPAYKKQNVEIQVSSKLSPFNLKFDDEDSGLPLTPVVHCLSPGRYKFCKRVQLKIPHRAILEENSRFRVRYSHCPLGTKMKWKTLEMPSEKQQNNVDDDFSFTVDEKYFYISTLHFTAFLCESCGKNVNLNLQSVIYGRYELRDGVKQEVYFNVYIFDAILDSEKAIEKNERAHAQRSEHYSLKPNESMNQWCIALLQPPDWKWKLDPRFDGKQEIKMETLHCHFQSDAPVPPFVKFKVVAVTDEQNNKLHSHIDAMFTIVQIRKPPFGSNIIEDSETKQKLSLDFNFADIQQDSKSSKTTRQSASSFADAVNDPCVVDDITLNKIAEELDENDWKSTIRHLFVGEGEEGDNVLKNVDHDQRTFKEKKYASLKKWKNIKGSSATYSELQDALKKARATLLASSLQHKVDETSGQEKIEIQIESTS